MCNLGIVREFQFHRQRVGMYSQDLWPCRSAPRNDTTPGASRSRPSSKLEPKESCSRESQDKGLVDSRHHLKLFDTMMLLTTSKYDNRYIRGSS